MLDNGTPLPAIQATNLDGQRVSLDATTSGSWSVVLFYRGHW